MLILKYGYTQQMKYRQYCALQITIQITDNIVHYTLQTMHYKLQITHNTALQITLQITDNTVHAFRPSHSFQE